jgi:iron complex outermembrane recepter protein
VASWRSNVVATYLHGPVTVSATWRWISAGRASTSFFDNPNGPYTIDNNSIPAVSYLDLGLSYKFKVMSSDVEFYGRVTNALDTAPPVIADSQPFTQQYNPSLYDGIGRFYRAGFRVKFW